MVSRSVADASQQSTLAILSRARMSALINTAPAL